MLAFGLSFLEPPVPGLPFLTFFVVTPFFLQLLDSSRSEQHHNKPEALPTDYYQQGGPRRRTGYVGQQVENVVLSPGVPVKP